MIFCLRAKIKILSINQVKLLLLNPPPYLSKPVKNIPISFPRPKNNNQLKIRTNKPPMSLLKKQACFLDFLSHRIKITHLPQKSLGTNLKQVLFQKGMVLKQRGKINLTIRNHCCLNLQMIRWTIKLIIQHNVRSKALKSFNFQSTSKKLFQSRKSKQKSQVQWRKVAH